jgi:A/G-specific adenine glycosylase
MLQQTQVARVESYFKDWMKSYPSWKALAKAPLRDVLLSWQGLGYNRRGKYLHDIATIVRQHYRGRLPADRASLESLPGIGHYTAGSIRAFAFNELDIFLETNIRTVLFYHFYDYTTHSPKTVADRELLGDLETYVTSDQRASSHPREFYYALMDYGSHLKQTVGNLNRQSKSYTTQSKFAGSRRQLRSQLLRSILTAGPITLHTLSTQHQADQVLIEELLNELTQEGSVKQHHGKFSV